MLSGGGRTIIAGAEGDYSQLKDAVLAAEAGDTVKMLEDMDIAAADFIKITKSLTLDMNGHYIALTETTQAAVQVNGSGIDVTIKNGTIRNAGATYGSNKATNGIYVVLCDSCTLENVTITNAAQGVYGCRKNTILNNCTIDASTSGIVTNSSYNSTTTIDGGHIKGAKYGIYNQRNTSEIKIQSGLIEGTDAAVMLLNGGTLTATGGTIQGTRYYGIWAYSSAASTVNISGNAQVFGPTNALKSQHANSNIIINGGTLNSNSTTIMLNKGNLTISDNALITSAGNYGVFSESTNTTGNITINGGSIGTAENRIGYGIGMKAGTLTLNGGSVYAYARGIASQGGTLIVNDGVNIDIAPTAEHLVNGAAIALVAPASTPINATVNGGTFNATGMAFTQTAGTATINGGSFNGDVRAVELIAASANATLTIENGSFASKHNTVAATSLAAEYTATLDIKGGTFVLTPDNISTPSTDAVTISGNTTDNSGERAAYPAIVNISGGTFSGGYAGVSLWGKGSVANISGGSIDADAFAICGNGTPQYNGTEINITGGTIGSATTAAGIYHPQAGTLTITGGIISGKTGIGIKSGTFTMTGGTIHAYGEGGGRTETYGNGLSLSNAALQIESNDAYAGNMEITISDDANLFSDGWYSIYEYVGSANAPTAVNSIAVSGGHFRGGILLSQSMNAKGGFLTGGTWVDDISSYCAPGKVAIPLTSGDEYDAGYRYIVGDPTTETAIIEPTAGQTVLLVSADASAADIAAAESVSDKQETKTASALNQVVVSTNTDVVAAGDNDVVEVKKVTVSGGTLTVKQGATLFVGAGALHIDDNANSKVIVEAGATLVVDGLIYGATADNLIIETAEGNAGILLFSPETEFITEDHPEATVNLYTYAQQVSANPWNYVYQRFAIPMRSIDAPTNDFSGSLFAGESVFESYLYRWSDDKEWENFSGWSNLVPFKGYLVANNSVEGGVTYSFTGNLIGNNDGQFDFNTRGFEFFGNSYTAPIYVASFLQDFAGHGLEGSVWVYDYLSHNFLGVNMEDIELGDVAAPEIASMQAFILRLTDATSGTAPISYSNSIWSNPRFGHAAPAPAMRRQDFSDIDYVRIMVESASGMQDRFVLSRSDDYTASFDNGSDISKYIHNEGLNLYANTSCGQLSRVATPSVDDLTLGFRSKGETTYTLRFAKAFGESFMLRDNVTGAEVLMSEGATYTFNQAANSSDEARFTISAVKKTPTAMENVEAARMENKGIYSMQGQYLGEDLSVLPAGAYIMNGNRIVK